MSEAAASEVALLKRPTFVGRAPELRALKDALRRAKGGEGSAWLLEGPEGIGKTRVARWVEELARTDGFEVRWGYGVREGMVPFLPYELMFRASRKGSTAPLTDAVEPGNEKERPPIVLVEEARPRRFWTRVERLVSKGPLLVASRERPTAIRANRPALAEAKAVLWITRLEGPEHVAPGALDALADRFEEHLRSAPGATVALEGTEYLVSQGSFLPVLRLVQFLRDVAQETGGQLVLSLNPASLEPREVSLLEAESEVDSPEAAASPETATAPAPNSPTQTLLHLLSQVEEASEHAPQLLVLDDLQWADAPSQRAFQFLVRNTRDRPVLWIACLRTEEPDGDGVAAAPSPFQEIGEHLESEGALQTLPLRPLDTLEIRHLIEGATEVPLDLEQGDPEFRGFLARTGGNPHFALSSLRLLWEQGRIRHRGDRAVVVPSAAEPTAASTPSLPSTLQSTAVSRIALLEAEERRFLTRAALVGKDFDLVPVAPLLGRSVEEVRSTARRLEALHGLVRPLPGPSDRWTFQDGTVWDAALAALPSPERREASRQLGLWWAENRVDEVETIARLLYASADAPLALPWIRKAIDHSLALQSPDAVERYLQWVRELSPTDPASTAVRAADEVALARQLRRIGSNRSALRVLRAIQSLELPLPLRRDRDLALVDVLTDADVTESRARLDRLEREIASAPPGEVSAGFRARVLGSRAFLDMTQGHFQDGRKAAEEALATLPPLGEEREQARDQFTAGWCALELEDWDAAERHFVDALSVSRANSLKTMISASLNGLAALSYFLGDLQGARRYYEEGIRVERDAGEAQRTISILLNLAETEISAGDTARAWTLHEEAARLAEKFDLPRWRAGAAALRGDLLDREGRWAEALQAYQLATEASRTQPLQSRQTQILIGTAWAKGEMGDPKAGLAILEELRKNPEGLAAQYTDLFHQIRGRLKELDGDPDGAHRDLETARSHTGPSPHRQARILGDLSSWEGLHGDAARQNELRTVADRLYASAGVDPAKARVLNEVFAPAAPPRAPIPPA